MITTLKLRAYLVPVLLFSVSIILIICFISSINNSLYELLFILLYFLFVLGNLIFILFSYYKEYSVDSKNLMIRDRITQKQIIIPLSNITDLKIKEVHTKYNEYHNIIVETKDKKYILKGAYVEDMTHFFSKLEKALKRIS